MIIIHNKHGVGCCLIFLLLLSGCVPASAASVRLIVSSSSGRNPKQDSPPSLPSPIEKHNTTTQREREKKSWGEKGASFYFTWRLSLSLLVSYASLPLVAARESHTANGLCITKPLRVYLGFHTDRTRPSGSQPSLASRKTFSVADSTCSDSDTLLGQSDTATLCSATALCCYSFPRSLSPYKQVRRHFLTIRVCTRKGVCRLLCSFAAPCFLLHGTAVFSVKAEQQRLPPLSLFAIFMLRIPSSRYVWTRVKAKKITADGKKWAGQTERFEQERH